MQDGLQFWKRNSHPLILQLLKLCGKKKQDRKLKTSTEKHRDISEWLVLLSLNLQLVNCKVLNNNLIWNIKFVLSADQENKAGETGYMKNEVSPLSLLDYFYMLKHGTETEDA